MKKIISLSILLSIISFVGFEKKMYDNDLTFINSKNYESKMKKEDHTKIYIR